MAKLKKSSLQKIHKRIAELYDEIATAREIVEKNQRFLHVAYDELARLETIIEINKDEDRL